LFFRFLGIFHLAFFYPDSIGDYRCDEAEDEYAEDDVLRVQGDLPWRHYMESRHSTMKLNGGPTILKPPAITGWTHG
jgi:hypothetical protein